MADDQTIGTDTIIRQWGNVLLSSRIRICVGVSILLVVAVVVIVLVFTSNQTDDDAVEQYTAFMGALNTSANPCSDFYEFSCGLWPLIYPLSAYRNWMTMFDVVQEDVNKRMMEILNNASESPELPVAVNNAIKFYKLCVARNSSHEDDYRVLTDYLDQIGGWPIEEESHWNKSRFDWLNATAFYAKHFDVNTVFHLSLSLSQTNALLTIRKPAFRYISTEMLYAVLLKVNCTKIDLVNILVNANNKLKEVLYKSVKTTDSLVMSVKDLIEEIPGIDWLRYFNLVYEDSLLAMNRSFSINDSVAIDNINYLKKVDGVMNSDIFSNFELANLFGSYLAIGIKILIPDVIKTYSQFLAIDENEQLSYAKLECFEIINEVLKSSLDYLYVKYSSSENEKVKKLYQSVKTAFGEAILLSKWLDGESKSSALDLLNEMKEVIGFPLYLANKTEFDMIHDNFPNVSRNILGSYLELQNYTEHTRAYILPRSVTSTSAYYISAMNEVVFPVSLYNPPFYYANGPSYLNFGATGVLLAHEMMHAFGSFEDNVMSVTGRGFATDSANAHFKNHSQCFVEQYDNYDKSATLSNSGIQTLRENVADSEGLRIAFEAHKQYEANVGYTSGVHHYGNYTADQMFFISFATIWCSKVVPGLLVDPHSLPSARVNGAVSNSKAFAEAFKCPENSPMNSCKKCQIW